MGADVGVWHRAQLARWWQLVCETNGWAEMMTNKWPYVCVSVCSATL